MHSNLIQYLILAAGVLAGAVQALLLGVGILVWCAGASYRGTPSIR